MFETFPAEVTDSGRLKLVPVDVQAEEIHVYLCVWASEQRTKRRLISGDQQK